MSNPAIYTWPAADEAAVSAIQGVNVGAFFVLNGTLATSTSATGGVSFGGNGRTVSLTSIGDNSTSIATIRGVRLGQPVYEIIAGPGPLATVYTLTLFDSITSIEVTVNPMIGVSVGSGDSGLTPWFQHDVLKTFPAMAVQVEVLGVINYTYIQTLDDAFTVAVPYKTLGLLIPDAVAASGWSQVMDASIASTLAWNMHPSRYSCIRINHPSPDGLIATFLQQGAR